MKDIDTTRSSSGELSTATMGVGGASPYSGLDLGGFLSKIYDMKKQPQAPSGGQMARAAMPSMPTYAPQMGAQQTSPAYAATRRQPATRMRRFSKGMLPGDTYQPDFTGQLNRPEMRQEKQLEDGSWEFDGIAGVIK